MAAFASREHVLVVFDILKPTRHVGISPCSTKLGSEDISGWNLEWRRKTKK
jgi:hypothetical protein